MIYEDTKTNINNINDYEYLYKNYFLVPENFDEQKIVDDLRIRLQKPIDDLYLERIPLYEKYADITVSSEKIDLATNAENIAKKLNIPIK